MIWQIFYVLLQSYLLDKHVKISLNFWICAQNVTSDLSKWCPNCLFDRRHSNNASFESMCFRQTSYFKKTKTIWLKPRYHTCICFSVSRTHFSVSFCYQYKNLIASCKFATLVQTFRGPPSDSISWKIRRNSLRCCNQANNIYDYGNI